MDPNNAFPAVMNSAAWWETKRTEFQARLKPAFYRQEKLMQRIGSVSSVLSGAQLAMSAILAVTFKATPMTVVAVVGGLAVSGTACLCAAYYLLHKEYLQCPDGLVTYGKKLVIQIENLAKYNSNDPSIKACLNHNIFTRKEIECLIFRSKANAATFAAAGKSYRTLLELHGTEFIPYLYASLKPGDQASLRHSCKEWFLKEVNERFESIPEAIRSRFCEKQEVGFNELSQMFHHDCLRLSIDTLSKRYEERLGDVNPQAVDTLEIKALRSSFIQKINAHGNSDACSDRLVEEYSHLMYIANIETSEFPTLYASVVDSLYAKPRSFPSFYKKQKVLFKELLLLPDHLPDHRVRLQTAFLGGFSYPDHLDKDYSEARVQLFGSEEAARQAVIARVNFDAKAMTVEVFRKSHDLLHALTILETPYREKYREIQTIVGEEQEIRSRDNRLKRTEDSLYAENKRKIETAGEQTKKSIRDRFALEEATLRADEARLKLELASAERQKSDLKQKRTDIQKRSTTSYAASSAVSGLPSLVSASSTRSRRYDQNAPVPSLKKERALCILYEQYLELERIDQEHPDLEVEMSDLKQEKPKVRGIISAVVSLSASSAGSSQSKADYVHLKRIKAKKDELRIQIGRQDRPSIVAYRAAQETIRSAESRSVSRDLHPQRYSESHSEKPSFLGAALQVGIAVAGAAMDVSALSSLNSQLTTVRKEIGTRKSELAELTRRVAAMNFAKETELRTVDGHTRTCLEQEKMRYKETLARIKRDTAEKLDTWNARLQEASERIHSDFNKTSTVVIPMQIHGPRPQPSAPAEEPPPNEDLPPPYEPNPDFSVTAPVGTLVKALS